MRARFQAFFGVFMCCVFVATLQPRHLRVLRSAPQAHRLLYATSSARALASRSPQRDHWVVTRTLLFDGRRGHALLRQQRGAVSPT